MTGLNIFMELTYFLLLKLKVLIFKNDVNN